MNADPSLMTIDFNSVSTLERRQAAAEYLERGWVPIPLDAENASTVKWTPYQEAHPNTDTIWRWSYPGGIGLVQGVIAGTFVVDLDVKDGKNGVSTLKRLCAENDHDIDDLFATYHVRTRSGGLHLYFKHPGQHVKTSKGELGEGIDIRGDGGYVAAPPGPGYQVECDDDPIDAPDWLVALVCPAPRATAAQPRQDQAYRDDAGMLDIAALWGEAQRGQSWREPVMKLVGHYLGRGLDTPTILTMAPALTRFDLINPKTRTPYTVDDTIADLRVFADQCRAKDWGKPDQAAGFSVGSPKEISFLHPDDIELDYGCEKYLVKGLFDTGDLTLVYGASGSGKSFLCIYMAYCLASGKSFLARRTKPSPVLYITLEGREGFKKRIKAIEQEGAFTANDNFFFLCCKGGDFSSDEFKKTLVSLIKSSGIKAVFIDTLARFLNTEDENTSQGMMKAIEFADIVSEETEASTIYVHHSGKNSDQGARGHSSLRAAVDAELLVSKPSDSVLRRVSLTKVKDSEDGATFDFDLISVPLGIDVEGDEISSCIATGFARATSDDGAKKPRLSPIEKQYYSAINDFFASGGGVRRAPINGNSFITSVGNISEILPLLTSRGIAKIAGVSDDEKETRKSESLRARSNRQSAAKYFGKIRDKGYIAYENGDFWFTDREELYASKI